MSEPVKCGCGVKNATYDNGLILEKRHDNYRYACECGAKGPHAPTPSEAADKWNLAMGAKLREELSKDAEKVADFFRPLNSCPTFAEASQAAEHLSAALKGPQT